MPTQVATIEDLEKFKDDLLEANAVNQKRYLKSSDVMEILSISYSKLQTLRINGTLPFTKIGGTCYYKSEDLDRLFN